MLRLEATLVTTSTARLWRGGWSLDQGTDFIVRSLTREPTSCARAEGGRTVAGEPVSFLDADHILPAGMTIVTRYGNLAARHAEPAVHEPVDLPLTRAWCSMARKVAGS